MKFMRQYLLSLLLLCGLSSGAWSAADLCTTAVISQTDASNGSGTQPSWLGSAAPSTIDDAGRALQGAIAREYAWRNFTATSAGSSTAYTLTYTVAPIAYCAGQVYSFIVDEANGADATVNVNALGAVTVKKLVAGTLTNLSANDWKANDRISLSYNATGPVLVWVNRGAADTPSGSITSSGYTQTTARLLGRTTASTGAIEEMTVGSGLSLSAGALTATGATVDVQTFTATGADTWEKPTGGQTMCLVEIWGAGGSGGKGAAAAAAGGGGGGAYKRKLFLMSALGATEPLSIATGGVAQTSASTAGNVGGDSTFGAAATLVTAYGGGGGGNGATGSGGGGGGGVLAAGGSTSTTLGGTTDGFNAAATGPYGNAGGNGVASGSATTPPPSYLGGAGGGGSTGDAAGANSPGGASEYAGAGGGAAAEDSAPGAGAGGASTYGGNGGAGAFDANNATAGTQPGGGGGGSETGTSGAGGNGKAVVTCW